MSKKALKKRQAGWATALAAYDFVISHRPGKMNPADAPSRRPDYAGEDQGLRTLLPTLQRKLALTPSELPEQAQTAVAALRIAIWKSGQIQEESLDTRRGDAAKSLPPPGNTDYNQWVPRKVVQVMATELSAYTSESDSFRLLLCVAQRGDALAKRVRNECGTDEE